MNINTVLLCGRLTRDCEMRYTPAGTAVGTFTLAISKVWNKDGQKQEETSFIGVVAFGKTADLVAQYVKKGDELAVRGSLKQEKWVKDDKTHSKIVVIAQEVMFGAKKKDNQTDNQTPQQQGGMDSLGENPPF